MTEISTRSRPTLVKAILHLEGLLVLVAATAAYVWLGLDGWRFAALFLLPDLAMLGYLAGVRVGALLYDLGHTYAVPLVVLGLAIPLGSGWGLSVGLIWLAHIGFDRALGYGLKYGTGFRDTHLGRV